MYFKKRHLLALGLAVILAILVTPPLSQNIGTGLINLGQNLAGQSQSSVSAGSPVIVPSFSVELLGQNKEWSIVRVNGIPCVLNNAGTLNVPPTMSCDFSKADVTAGLR